MSLLRSETSDSHRAAESAVDVEGMLTDLQSYRDGLAKFYRIWHPLEKAVRVSGGAFPPEMEERWRADRLTRDLGVLGLEAESIELMLIDFEVLTQAEVTGVLYVMEGSTLGGQIVAKMISDRLGLSSTDGAAFFTAHGKETSRRWKEFGKWADDILSDAEYPQCLAAARRTFEALQRSFS